MVQRLPVNSDSLKQRFPDVYRSFFSKCEIVCSAPRSMIWTGGLYFVKQEGLTLRHSIPNRSYVGITPRSQPDIQVRDVISYHPLHQTFETDTLPGYEKDLFERSFISFLKTECGISLQSGFDVYVLSESVCESGIGSIGGYFAACVSCFLLYAQKVTPEQIKQWSMKTTGDLIRDRETKFDEVMRVIWKWELINYSTASGANMMNALLPSPVPILYSSRRVTVHPNAPGSSDLARTDSHSLPLDEKRMYWCARTNEVFDEHIGWPLPCDYGIITVTETQPAPHIISSGYALERELSDVAEEILAFGPKFFDQSDLNDADLPLFYTYCLAQNRSKLWQHSISSITVLALRLLIQLKRTIEQGFSQKRMDDLFQLLNQQHQALTGQSVSNPYLEEVASELKTVLSSRIGEDAIAVCLNFASRGGNLLFATQAAGCRSQIDDVLRTVGSKLKKNLMLSYASWIDGYEKEGGLKIEQWLEQGIYSELMRADALKLVRWNEKSDARVSIEEPDSFQKNSFDLLIDLQRGKLYVAGHECTSKELPSQKMTAKILHALLSTETHRLQNKLLVPSSYTKYRNELQGKIVGPLVALVKQRLGRDLLFKVEGTLTNFTVSIDPKGFQIGMLSPIEDGQRLQS